MKSKVVRIKMALWTAIKERVRGMPGITTAHFLNQLLYDGLYKTATTAELPTKPGKRGPKTKPKELKRFFIFPFMQGPDIDPEWLDEEKDTIQFSKVLKEYYHAARLTGQKDRFMHHLQQALVFRDKKDEVEGDRHKLELTQCAADEFRYMVDQFKGDLNDRATAARMSQYASKEPEEEAVARILEEIREKKEREERNDENK